MTNPAQNAEAAYEQAHVEALAGLARIEELLHDMPAPEGEVRIDWTHVGTLVEVNRRLQEIVAFLGGTES